MNHNFRKLGRVVKLILIDFYNIFLELFFFGDNFRKFFFDKYGFSCIESKIFRIISNMEKLIIKTIKILKKKNILEYSDWKRNL